MEKLFETAEITSSESVESDVLDNSKENIEITGAEKNMDEDCQLLINVILDVSNEYTYDNSENNEELIRQLENEFEKLGYWDLFKLEKANLSNYINNLWHPLGGKDINNFFDNKASRKFAFYYNIKKARTLWAWDDSYNYVITDLLNKDKDWATKALSDKEIIEKTTQWTEALNEHKKETLENVSNKKILLISSVDVLFELDYSSTGELHKAVCDKLEEFDLEILEEDMNLIFKSSKNNIDEYKSLVYDFLNWDYFDKAFILHKFENIEDDKEDEIDTKEDEEESKKDEKDEEEEIALMQEFLDDKESLDITQDEEIGNDDIKAYKQETKTRIQELRNIITNEIQGEIKATREDKKNLRNWKKEIRDEIKEMKKKLQELRKDVKNNKEEIKKQRERIKQKRGNLEKLKKECNKKRKEYTDQIDKNREKRREYRNLIQKYKKERRESIVEIKQEIRQENIEIKQVNQEKRQRKQERSKPHISETLNELSTIEYNSLEDLRTKILDICNQNWLNFSDKNTKSLIYTAYDSRIKRWWNETPKSYIILYGLACGVNISTQQDLFDFVETVKSNGSSGKYAQQYKNFLNDIWQYYNESVTEVAKQSLIKKYEGASIPSIKRKFYESDFVNFVASKSDNQQDLSWLKVASNIDNVNDKLDQYSFKPNKTKHEETTLKYVAFNISFRNIFALNNAIFKKLETHHINLRDDLFKYSIYSQADNYFNESAWNKYVAEKLEPLWLTPEEIGQLWSVIAWLQETVKKNYEILSGNFDADQENFEKIAKIYALWEIIDNIKNLFTNENILSENLGSWTNLWFEFNEDSADIVWDCLILKWKANWTEATIKYDLRTWKLYMNSFMQQEFNPPKITIWNNEPNTEIWNIWNFDDLLDGYKHMSSNRGRNMKHRRPYDNNRSPHSTNKKNFREIDDDYINAKILKRLMRNKLLGKLSEIWKIVKEKAWEQSMENNVIDDFLKTFNILSDGWNSSTIEFLWWSNLYILLEAIKNTDNEDHLLKFSNFMNELMWICWLNRWKNNLHSKEHETDSVTIFDIDEKNATQDIISLQKANQSFFSEWNGEKDKIKSCESHFDASVQLSFANIIVQKCCIRSEGSRKISDNLTEEFVNSIKEWIETIKHDENDVLAMETIIDNDSTWS